MSKRRHPLRTHNTRARRAPYRPRLTLTISFVDRVTPVMRLFQEENYRQIVEAYRMKYPMLREAWDDAIQNINLMRAKRFSDVVFESYLRDGNLVLVGMDAGDLGNEKQAAYAPLHFTRFAPKDD